MIDIQQLKRELAETEAEVAALTQEQTELALEESQLSQRLEEVKKRQSELRNGYHRFGLIGRAKERHRRLQLKLTDLKKRLVVWTLKRNWSTRECDYVVSRVTAKRIYIRELGEDKETHYDLDGSRGKYDGVIDIEKTFPEGLDEYRKQTR